MPYFIFFLTEYAGLTLVKQGHLSYIEGLYVQTVRAHYKYGQFSQILTTGLDEYTAECRYDAI